MEDSRIRRGRARRAWARAGRWPALRRRWSRPRRSARLVELGEWGLDEAASSKCSTYLRVPAGRTLARAGERGREVFLVLGGVASVHAPRTGVRLATRTRGSVCGELAVLWRQKRTADVVANTDMEILVMTPSEFSSWMHADDRFADLVLAQATAHVFGLDDAGDDGPAPWA